MLSNIWNAFLAIGITLLIAIIFFFIRERWAWRPDNKKLTRLIIFLFGGYGFSCLLWVIICASSSLGFGEILAMALPYGILTILFFHSMFKKIDGESFSQKWQAWGYFALVIVCAVVRIVLNFSDVEGSTIDENAVIEMLPEPDHVVVYKDGTTERYDEGSSQYNKIVKRLKVPSTEKLETMIEDETVSEAKQDYAIEYVYDTKQYLADSTFEFENVLFFMSGWCKGEAAFGNDESYESGTIVFYY